jgi:HK97 gp10 family phage protein
MLRSRLTQFHPRIDAAGVQKRIDRVVDETADEVVKIAQDIAPRDTGAMADSIRKEEVAGGKMVVVGDDDKITYPPFVEFGTVYQEAQPFLRPAVNATKSRLRRRLGQIQAGLAEELGTNTRTRR